MKFIQPGSGITLLAWWGLQGCVGPSPDTDTKDPPPEVTTDPCVETISARGGYTFEVQRCGAQPGKVIKDPTGAPVQALPFSSRERFTKDIRSFLADGGDPAERREVVLVLPETALPTPNPMGDFVTTVEKGVATVQQGGAPLSEERLAALVQQASRLRGKEIEARQAIEQGRMRSLSEVQKILRTAEPTGEASDSSIFRHDQTNSNLSGPAIASLSRDQIRTLVESGRSTIIGIEPVFKTEDTDGISDRLALANLPEPTSPTQHGMGEDVAIFQVEGGCFTNDLSNLPLTRFLSTSSPKTNHANTIAWVLGRAAPSSIIVCSPDTVADLPSSGTHTNGADLRVINRSNVAPGVMYYNDLDKRYDDRAYLDGLTAVVAAGNGGKKTKNTPTTAYNVISVGAFDSASSQIYSGSAWGSLNDNPFPDVVAPGVDFETPFDVDGHAQTGTSLAVPVVAGGIARMMSDASWALHKGNPAVFLALTLATAKDTVVGNAKSDRQGAGAFRHPGGGTYGIRSITDGADFDANDRILWKTPRSFAVGDRVRVAIAFLVSGTYAYIHKQPEQDFDLFVFDATPDSPALDRAVSATRNEEWVDVVVKAKGPLTIVVHRFHKGAGAPRLAIAYALQKP